MKEPGIQYYRAFCVWPCKDYTIHYCSEDSPSYCIRHEPDTHDLGDFLWRKHGYKWLKHLRESKKLMEYGSSVN